MVSPPNCHCQEFGGEATVDILRSELTIPKYIPWDSQGSWIFYNSWVERRIFWPKIAKIGVVMFLQEDKEINRRQACLPVGLFFLNVCESIDINPTVDTVGISTFKMNFMLKKVDPNIFLVHFFVPSNSGPIGPERQELGYVLSLGIVGEAGRYEANLRLPIFLFWFVDFNVFGSLWRHVSKMPWKEIVW